MDIRQQILSVLQRRYPITNLVEATGTEKIGLQLPLPPCGSY